VPAVVLPYADLRQEPDPDGERVSQLLYGEQPEILARTGSWLHVRGAGGVEGWLAGAGLGQVAVKGEPAVVAVPWLGIKTGRGKVALPMGARVRIQRGRGVTALFYQRDELIHVPAGAIRPAASPGGKAVMMTSARRLLGSPYLWGGLTAQGIDCSGLIYLAARVAGLTLPRDAGKQFGTGRPVDRRDLEPGDLVFYTSAERSGPSHVAIYNGSGQVIQAVRQGGVCLAPVTKPTPALTWYGARRIWP